MAIPAGLTAGALGWLAAGGASASATKLEPVRSLVAAVHRPKFQAVSTPPADVTELRSLPLLLLTTGPGAVPEPLVRLDGLVRSRIRKAALLSINDKPADWLSLGEKRDSVSLQEVGADHVVVDTPFGLQDVALGERAGPSAVTPPAAGVAPPPTAVPQALVDKVPPGFRAPLPPASAPRSH